MKDLRGEWLNFALETGELKKMEKAQNARARSEDSARGVAPKQGACKKGGVLAKWAFFRECKTAFLPGERIVRRSRPRVGVS